MENIRFDIQVVLGKDATIIKNLMNKSTDFYVRYNLRQDLCRFVTRQISWNIGNLIRRELTHEIN